MNSDIKYKTCRRCGESKPEEDFSHKRVRCDECLSDGEGNTINNHKHFVAKCNELTEKVRYMNAVKVPNFKFEGNIPRPKETIDYLGNRNR